MPRRTALRLAASVALAGAGAALQACAAADGASRTSQAQPAPTNTPITLRLAPIIEGGLGSVRAAETNLISQFEQANPGVRVTFTNPAGPQATTAAIAAGDAPDVFWDYHYAPYLEKNALLRLDEFLRRDNIDPDRWSAAQMTTLRVATPALAGTFALPAFFGTQVYAINLDDFAAKHIERPAPDWSYTDFTRLASSLSGTASNGQRHYGASMEWYANQTGDGEIRWLFNAFRGGFIGSRGLTLEIDGPESITAGQWMYEDLLWLSSAEERQPGATAGRFASGQMSMAAVGNWGLKALVDSVPRNLHFDFQPFPIFPAGRTAFGTDDFYAIPRTTRHPEQAWALLRWLSAEPDWQRAQIRLQLLSPALNSLWPEWVTAVQEATGVLKGKAVHYFADAATGAYALPPQYFSVADTQAQGIIGGYISRLHARQLHVDVAFREAVRQVNSVVSAAAAKAAQKQQSSTASAGSAAGFAPPSSSGLGRPAQKAHGAVEVGGGGYTLTGAGSGVFGTSDGCVYLCRALVEGGGTFTCRLDSVSTAGGGTAAPGYAAGLMVRGDLSDDAPALAIEVVGGRGVMVQVRPAARRAATSEAPAAPSATAGLIGAAALRLPVWLQLRREGLDWAAATSTDGSHFTPTGPRQPLAVAGCWVGLFVTSSGGAPVTARFTHTALALTGAWRIGG